MKHILCYGDSNTWGYRPDKPGCRFDEEVRWVGRLRRIMGPEYDFIEEGLNGRTTAFDDPICPGRNGLETLEAILLSHCPLDLVIIMLGVNDYKDYIHSSNYAMAEALGLLRADPRHLQEQRPACPEDPSDLSRRDRPGRP